MRWPATSVTMAFFQSGWNAYQRFQRRRLPGITMTLTACTLTFGKARSTAALICILLASGCTSKTYLPCSASTVPFSVTRGVRSTSQALMSAIVTYSSGSADFAADFVARLRAVFVAGASVASVASANGVSSSSLDLAAALAEDLEAVFFAAVFFAADFT